MDAIVKDVTVTLMKVPDLRMKVHLVIAVHQEVEVEVEIALVLTLVPTQEVERGTEVEVEVEIVLALALVLALVLTLAADRNLDRNIAHLPLLRRIVVVRVVMSLIPSIMNGQLENHVRDQVSARIVDAMCAVLNVVDV